MISGKVFVRPVSVRLKRVLDCRVRREKMVSYNRLWETMEKRKISQYRLIKEFGFKPWSDEPSEKNTYVSTHTLETLGRILDRAGIEDVMEVSFEDEKSEKQVHGR